MGAMRGSCRYTNHRQLAVNGGMSGHVFHQQHVDELVKVGFQSARAGLISINHDGHARHARLLSAPHGQRINVECPATKQRRHPRQHSRLIFHVDNKSIQHRLHASTAVSTSTPGLRIIWCKSAPAATMGYTVSSCSTLKSIRKAPS